MPISPKDSSRFKLKASETVTAIKQVTKPIFVKGLRHESTEGFLFLPQQFGVAGVLAKLDGLGTVPITAHEDNAFSVNGRGNGYTIGNLVGNSPELVTPTRRETHNVIRPPANKFPATTSSDRDRRPISGRFLAGSPSSLPGIRI